RQLLRGAVAVNRLAADEGQQVVARFTAKRLFRRRRVGEDEVIRARERDGGTAPRAERRGNAAAADQGRIAAGGVEGAAEPTVALVLLGVELRRLPDRHAAEVGALRIGVADAGDDREMSLAEQLVEGPQRRVETDAVVELDEVLCLELESRAELDVLWIGMRHDRVERVVAAV